MNQPTESDNIRPFSGGRQVESPALAAFSKVMQVKGALPSHQSIGQATPVNLPRVDIEENNVKNGLGRLVLTLVKLLHELLERQAIRQIDHGYLTEAEIERVGLALMNQSQELERLRTEFGLAEEDLNLDLGPLGKLF